MPVILSDSAQLEQVVLNLAVNAREAMPGGGEVRVETGRTVLEEPIVVEGGALLPAGEYLHMTVRDTGPGIPASLRGRIFERFFTTKHDSGVGGGFGLSTVQRIVRGHGGGIVLESPPDWGAASTRH